MNKYFRLKDACKSKKAEESRIQKVSRENNNRRWNEIEHKTLVDLAQIFAGLKIKNKADHRLIIVEIYICYFVKNQ